MKPPTTGPKIFAGFAAHDDDKQKGQAEDGGQVEVCSILIADPKQLLFLQSTSNPPVPQ